MNLFIDLSESDFLLAYWLLAGVILSLCYYYVTSKDSSASMPELPLPGAVDAYSVAYLKGELNGLALVAVVALAERGYLCISPIASSQISRIRTLERVAPVPERKQLNPLEKAVYDWFERPQPANELFALPGRLRSFGLIYEENHQRNALLSDPRRDGAGWLALLAAGSTLLAVAGLRLIMPIQSGEPVLPLLISLCLSLFALWVVCESGRLSARGDAYQKLLKNEGADLPFSSGGHYALATAVVGFSALAGTSLAELGELLEPVYGSILGVGDGSDGSDGGCGCGGCGG